MRKLVTWSVLIVCACAVSAFGQNKVVFDNQSGDPALVKLIGPTQAEIEVPNGAKAGTDAAPGRYVIKVRYGTSGNYRYAKGDEFTVTETTTARSETTITLHKVVAGNYDSKPISEKEFGKAEDKHPSSLPPSQTSAPPESNSGLEQKVYSMLVTDEHHPALMPESKTHFVITCAVQTDTTAEQLKAKCGEPKAIEKDVKYDTMQQGMIPSSHQGDLWFYGRLGVLIENGKAVVVVRRALKQGDDKQALTRAMVEAMNIGKPPQ